MFSHMIFNFICHYLLPLHFQCYFLFTLYWHACRQLIGYKEMGITPLTTIEIKFACGSLHLIYQNGAFT